MYESSHTQFKYSSVINRMSNQLLIKQGSYFFEFFKFHDFFHDLFYFSLTLGLAVTFENFENFTCFSTFWALKQFNRTKLWYRPKCVPFALSNYSSLSYVILALSSAVLLIYHTKSENFDFPWLLRTAIFLAMGLRTRVELR